MMTAEVCSDNPGMVILPGLGKHTPGPFVWDFIFSIDINIYTSTVLRQKYSTTSKTSIRIVLN